jgi:hypothetical protein
MQEQGRGRGNASLCRSFPTLPDTAWCKFQGAGGQGHAAVGLLTPLHPPTPTQHTLFLLRPHRSSPAPPIPTPQQVWERHVADPLLSEDALDLLSRLAASPACLPALAAHTLRPLSDTLSRAAAAGGGSGGQQQQQQPVLVEASCDLLAALVQPGQVGGCWGGGGGGGAGGGGRGAGGGGGGGGGSMGRVRGRGGQRGGQQAQQ